MGFTLWEHRKERRSFWIQQGRLGTWVLLNPTSSPGDVGEVLWHWCRAGWKSQKVGDSALWRKELLAELTTGILETTLFQPECPVYWYASHVFMGLLTLIGCLGKSWRGGRGYSTDKYFKLAMLTSHVSSFAQMALVEVKAWFPRFISTGSVHWGWGRVVRTRQLKINILLRHHSFYSSDREEEKGGCMDYYF